MEIRGACPIRETMRLVYGKERIVNKESPSRIIKEKLEDEARFAARDYL